MTRGQTGGYIGHMRSAHSFRPGAAAIVAVGALAAGCSTGGVFERAREVVLPISALEAPATVAPDAAIVGTVTVVSGGCRSFDRVDLQRSGSEVVVVARGRDVGGPGVACTADVRMEPRPFRVDPPHTGGSVRITALEAQGNVPAVTVQVR